MELSCALVETKAGWLGILGSAAGLYRLILPQASPQAVLSRLLNNSRCHSEQSEESRPFASAQGDKINNPVLSILDNRSIGATSDISFFGDLPHRLKRYFEGEMVAFPDKLDLADATPFQYAVWQVTRSIPYGETRSYAWVAQQIGMPQATRAVGQALAKNRLPIVVPCHRVTGKRGNLCGFRYGLEMKYHLLQVEAGGYTLDAPRTRIIKVPPVAHLPPFAQSIADGVQSNSG